jgi:hypothetical protein
MEDEDHFLAPLLSERLAALGLDAETYGPYLTGLLPGDAEENEGAEEDEWNGVLELLQASSETHSDDIDAWQDLKKELLEKHEEYKAHLKKVKAEEEAKRQEAARKAVVSIPDDGEGPAKKETTNKSSALDDQAKKDLLARYAYEQEGDEEELGDGDAPVSNKEAAKQADLEKARELRSKKTQTKREEQQKTKEAKLEKIKLKEERRKRTTRGERKR